MDRLLHPRDFPGKNTGVGCYFLLSRIFPTQGSNPHLLHWQADSLPSEPSGKPKENDSLEQIIRMKPQISWGKKKYLHDCVISSNNPQPFAPTNDRAGTATDSELEFY